MAVSVIMGGFIPFSTINSADNGSVAPYTADASGFITVTGPRDVAAFLNAGYFVQPIGQQKPNSLSADGAIPLVSGLYFVTKASAAALTLAAPTTAQDGMKIEVTSDTAFAHVITATGLLKTGTATVNISTFAAFAGASITMVARGGKWNVIANVATVLS